MVIPVRRESADIPFNDLRPLLREAGMDLRKALAMVFERGRFILGEEVAAFEHEFAADAGADYVVGVASGTAALELCLRAAGLAGSGREVITSPLTAPFTGLATLAAGCKPRFADIDRDTLLLSGSDVASRATRRTAAILPVHLYGQPCDLGVFSELARDLGAVLVQDACQAHGARCGKRPFTAFSPYVAYSFYPTKNLGCLGDGGAVATSRVAVAKKVRLLRDGGRTKNHISLEPGINARLDEVQACFLRVFLRRLRMRNEERRRLAALYEEALRDCHGIELVQQGEGSVFHIFAIRAKQRTLLRKRLARRGVATAIHYPVPLHLQPAFRDSGLKRGDLPEAERACREIVSLPLWPGMTDAAALRTAECIRSFYAGRH